ncbi:hypothetical protein [Streptomyces sp. NPDC008317]|uniref:hypothetical protein n=1 Tax=Streptomyces sp. NPDC008317 TaxID=3364827 RepID=UPI0036F01BA4
MPRSLRHFLIWLSCTVLTVTAVSLTVRFVVGSTAPLPPSARDVAAGIATNSPSSVVIGSPTATPRQSPTRTRKPTVSPSPSTRRPTATATSPSSAPAAPPSTASRPPDCEGGAGTHSFESTGGQASIRFGADAVCLVSAVPAIGFTTNTRQSAPDTLTITFTGARHRSELTATLRPQAKEVTSEVSW